MAVCRKVFVLYTGGTFGMKKDKDGLLVPQPLEIVKNFIISHTKLYDSEPIETSDGFIKLYKELADDDPEAKGRCYEILYKMEAPEKLIDSSSLTPEHWKDMAERIKGKMYDYDGFVIIHGTDTMAYTSSALSFILGDIKKPVIVTGAQMPIFHPRTDGLDNFIGSMLMAGYFCNRSELQQVMLYDLNKLYQGNRVVKFDCDSFSVFDSPDVYPLASLESKIKLISSEIKIQKVERSIPCHVEEFTAEEKSEVRVLRFFPGITEEYVRGILGKADGVILETFGSGNVPEFDWLKDVLVNAYERNVLMLNCTQVYRGTVLPIYAASKILTEAHVIPGYDITPEAAMTKMIWVLDTVKDPKKRREIMKVSVCGESCAPRTAPPSPPPTTRSAKPKDP